MTQELAIYNHAAELPQRATGLPSPEMWKVMLQMADEFVKSGLLPDTVKSASAAALIIAKGREIGLAPVYALSAINVIKGKPSLSAEAIMTLVMQSHGGSAMIIETTTAQVCEIVYRRREWDRARSHSFTIEMAKRAGLTSGNWITYPDAMLRARCIGAVGRMAFPDVLAGMAVTEDFDRDETDPEAPCDAAAYRRRWFAITKGTYLDTDEARHEFIGRFTDGQMFSLSDWLRDATDHDARQLIDTAERAIELWRQSGHDTPVASQEGRTAPEPPQSTNPAPTTVDELLHASWAELEKLREEHPDKANVINAKRTAGALAAIQFAYPGMALDMVGDIAALLAHEPGLTADAMTASQATVIISAIATARAADGLVAAIRARVEEDRPF